MNISIIENEKPNLAICKMKCDNFLNEKLEKYELTKFLNSHTTNLLIGRPKSGKTSLLYSFFKSNKLLKKTYHNIFVFQPNASRESMSDNIFGSLPKEKVFNELSTENLNNVMNQIKNNNDIDIHNCIIFDDMTAYLKDKETLKQLKEMIFNRRHLHISIFFLVQTYYSVPKEIRKLFNNVIVFKSTKEEINSIFEEIVEQKKEIIPIIIKEVFDKIYNFLFINVETGRLFKNWDEIIIS